MLDSPLDRFLPRSDAAGRHETIVRAPPGVVYEVARAFDLCSLPTVRFVFWLRARLMRAKGTAPAAPRGLGVDALLGMGWGILLEEPGHLLVAGATCEPWLANVVFTPVPPDRFRDHDAPGRVKIAWTLEAQPIAAGVTRFVTETRVAATDEGARLRFLRYWRWARIGILGIRLLVVPAIRRQADARWRASAGCKRE